MAILKDSIVSGNLRVTDTILTNIVQADTIKARSSSSSTTFGPGTSGQMLISNGTNVYWVDAYTKSQIDNWTGSTKITTLGTISSGTWNATAIGATKGGTGLTSYTKGDILYASDTNVLAKLGANTGTKKFLSMTSSTPTWAAIVMSDLPVANNVTTASAGSYVLDAYQGKVLNDKFGNYLPLAGGTMTGPIKRTFSASDQNAVISINGSNYDNYIFTIRDSTDTVNSIQYGYGLKYIGTGSGVANYLRLLAGNQTGTAITAIGINQSGQVGIGTDANTSYRLYVNGNTYLSGTLTTSGNTSLNGNVTISNSKSLTLGDGVLTWDSTASAWKLTGNFYATGFVSAGGLSSGSGTSGVDLDAVWDDLSDPDPTKVIDASHLSLSVSGGTATSGQYVSAISYANGTFTVSKTALPTLALAANGTRGGIQIGYTQSEKNYPVQLSSEKAYVNVPWTDTWTALSSTAAGYVPKAANGTTSSSSNTYYFLGYTGTTVGWYSLPANAFKDTTYSVGTAALLTAGTDTANRVWQAKLIADYVKDSINSAISSALYFRGESSTAITNGGTETATIGGNTWTAHVGDLVLYNGKEFAWDGSKWIQLGDESSWAAKTISITGTGYLSGGGTLEANRTLDVSSSKITNNTSATAVTASTNLITANTLYYHKGNSNIVTVGTITSGTWNGTAITAAYGGTGMSGTNPFTGANRIVYTSSATAMTTLAPNTTTTKKFLRMTGNGSAGAAPAWDTVTKSDVGLGNVENTALSTWAGSSHIDTVGTIATGTWQGTKIAVNYGGTGKTSWTQYGVVYASANTTLDQIANNTTTTRKFLRMVGANSAATAPVWDTVTKEDVGLGNVSNSTYAGGTAVTLNGTSKASSTASFYAPTSGGTANQVLISGGTGAPTWTNQSNLSVGTASKLGSSTVGSNQRPIYINNGTPTVSNPGEAFLTWGGQNFSGSYGPIDAAMVSELGACRTMFAKAAGIVVEYSTNGGSTWQDYAAGDSTNVALFSSGATFRLGKNDTAGGGTSEKMLRIILRTGAAGVYTSLNKFVIFISTGGSTGCYCTIRCRTQQNYEDGVDSWIVMADNVTISGYSGYNVINIASTTTYGNTKSSQYGEWQFIFGCTGFNSSSTGKGLEVNKIFGFGGVGWTTPSTMAKTGHLYSFDSSQNAIFPAIVRPASNNSATLGASSYRWSTVYGVNANFSGTGTISGNTSIGGTLTVGSSSARRHSSLYGVVNIYGELDFSEGIRLHHNGGISSIWFGAVNQTGYDAGMVGITTDATGLRFRAPASSSGTSPNDYMNILYGGNVGIGTTTPSYKLAVGGTLGVTGLSTLAGGMKLTTTKKIWFGDTYYIELTSDGIHTNAGFYSDSFVSSGGLSSAGGSSGIDENAMWNLLDATNEVISASHIPSIQNITGFGTYVYSAQLSRTANTVLAAPNGSNGVATFRTLTTADISNIETWITNKGYITSFTDTKVTQTATTTSAAYEILFSYTADNTSRTEGARKTSTLTYNPSTKALSTGGAVNGLTLSAQTTGFKISGGTTSKTLTVGADYTLAAACAKAVDTSISASSTSTNLPTSAAVASFVEGKGYITSYTNSTYKLTLNNTTNGASGGTSLGTLYAPTTGGTANRILIGNGATSAPVWTASATLASATSTTANTAAYDILTLGNNANVSTTTAHSEGKLVLYSAATKAHTIVGTSTTTDYTHTLPNDTGLLVTLSGGTAKGSSTKPIYVPNTGIVTECSTYAGGTAVTLNNSSKAASTASFYAPTAGGAANKVLIGNGTTSAPTWSEFTLTGTSNTAYNLANFVTSSGITSVSKGTATSGGAVSTSGGAVTIQFPTIPTDYWKTGDSRTANTVLAAPNGSAGAASFRALVAADIPTLAISKISGLQTALDGKQPLDSDLTAIAGISSGTGLLKRSVSGSTVSWSIDTNAYITGNQTITLSGDVSGSGTTSISVSIGSGKVTNAMLAGSIAWSKLSVTAANLTSLIGSTTYAPYNANGYLPLNGGTLSGTGNTVLTINTTNSISLLMMQLSGDDAGGIGVRSDTNVGVYLQNRLAEGSPLVNIASDGVFKYNNTNVFLHDGNYTSYTPILNSASTHATSASVIYAPTTAGTSGNWLKSSGSGAPVWESQSNFTAGKVTTTQDTTNALYLVGVKSGATTTLLYSTVTVTGGNLSVPGQLAVTGAISGSSDLSVGGAASITGAATVGGTFTAKATTFAANGYVASLSSRGWYRIYIGNRTANLGNGLILHIARGYNNTDNECYSFAISIKHNNLASITQLSGIATTRLITAIRIARNGNTSLCIDLYYNGTVANNVVVSGSGYGTFQAPTAINDTSSTFVEFTTIGNTTGTLASSGNIVAVGAVTAGAASDVRLKDNIDTITTENAKKIILALNPVTFEWNDLATTLYDGYTGKDLGFIAQEVEEILPQAIGTIFDKYKRLDTTKIIPPLVSVVQDHEARIKALEEENRELKKQLMIY